jgi:hypothetical protein
LLAFTQGAAISQPRATDLQVQGYIESLSGKSWQVKVSAAQALAKIGPSGIEAVPALLEATRDRYPSVRESAATALGEIAHGSTDNKVIGDVVRELLARCDDRPEVRSAARSAIVRIGAGVMPALINVLRSNPDVATRRFAAELLGDSEGLTVGLAASAMFFLNDTDSEVKLRSAAAITSVVEQCALQGRACVRELPNILAVKNALASTGDTNLRPYAAAAAVCLRYLEFLAPTVSKTKLASLVEGGAPYTAGGSLALLIAVGVASFYIVVFRKRIRRLEGRNDEISQEMGNKIRHLEEGIDEISQVKALQEQNEIARSVLNRFVAMPEREERPGFTIAAAFRYASDVSGDFYNWFSRTDGSVCVYLVDVEGSGIDAAIEATHAAQVLERTLTLGL